ncbi:hypothetical protein ACFQ07_22520 [Actinomadura adrarensis]|uniref:Uncharacterized protein n=1 Tax=Actinomadura adrarensis TaxID=1819600 RepID=A0ABW3CMS6_9ACTN
MDDSAPVVVCDVNLRAGRLAVQTEPKHLQMEDLQARPPARPCPELLDRLHAGPIDVETVPESALRKLLDAIRWEMRYDRDSHTVASEVTRTPEILPAQQEAAERVLGMDGDGDPAVVGLVPPARSVLDQDPLSAGTYGHALLLPMATGVLKELSQPDPAGPWGLALKMYAYLCRARTCPQARPLEHQAGLRRFRFVQILPAPMSNTYARHRADQDAW